MTCKRIVPTLLALLLSLFAILGIGCGGSGDPVNPPPPLPSGETGITGLTISVGELSPSFSPNVQNYSTLVGYLGEASIGLTVTLKDTKARLTINNGVCASGSLVNVPLVEGLNAIRVMVTSEDGRNSNYIALNVKKLPFNTRVYVLNGMGGVPVGNAKLTLTDSNGKVLLENVPLPKADNGKLLFGLEPTQKYNIYATGDYSSVACYANFDPAEEAKLFDPVNQKECQAALYCLRNSTTFFALEAPVIEEIAFATSNADDPPGGWKAMPNNATYAGPAAGVAAVKVTVRTKNLIARSEYPYEYDEYTAQDRVPYPVYINIDNVASANNGGQGGTGGTRVGTLNAPVVIDGAVWYRSAYRTALPFPVNISNRNHFLTVMAADLIGNRTERRVYMNITDSAAATLSDPDLTGVVPERDLAQAQTFVGHGNFAAKPGDDVSPDAIGEVDNYNGCAQVNLRFYARTSSTQPVAIRGFEVWRSIGNESNFVKLATTHYATLASSTGLYEYIDRTPSITEGKMYYKFRFFNGNPANKGYSQFSHSVPVDVLPPFIARPAASHQLVSNKLWPTFRIAVSDPRALSVDYARQLRICLFVKNVADPYAFMLVPFAVDFAHRIMPNDPYDWAGKPAVFAQMVTDYSSSTSEIAAGAWVPAYDTKVVQIGVDDEGNPITKTEYTPFAYIDDDGSIVINTDSVVFHGRAADPANGITAVRGLIDNAVRLAAGNTGETFLPGATYFYNFYGSNAGISWNSSSNPHRWTSINSSQGCWFGSWGTNTHLAPDNTTFQGVSYGSSQIYDWGSPEGWFTMIIAPEAR